MAPTTGGFPLPPQPDEPRPNWLDVSFTDHTSRSSRHRGDTENPGEALYWALADYYGGDDRQIMLALAEAVAHMCEFGKIFGVTRDPDGTVESDFEVAALRVLAEFAD